MGNVARLLIAVVGLTVITVLWWLLADSIWSGFERILMLTTKTVELKDILIVLAPIMTYVLIGATVLLLVNIFKPLRNNPKQDGLFPILFLGLEIAVWGSIILAIFSGFLAFLVGIMVGENALLHFFTYFLTALAPTLVVSLSIALCVCIYSGLFREFAN